MSDNQVVLITGALTGIGRATAIAFAKEGARLIVSGRHDEAGRSLADELRGLGAEVEFIRSDVRQDEAVGDLVDRSVLRFGRLDVLVNNVGTEGVPGPVAEQTAESYAVTFDTNVLGTIFGMKHALRVMRPRERGSIVNVSSTMFFNDTATTEIYTGPYAEACVSADCSAALDACVRTARAARAAGLLVNAGHDLNQRNLPRLRAVIPDLAEVSIGHALISEALYTGLIPAVHAYLALLRT